MLECVCWYGCCADEEEEQGAEVSSERDEKHAGSLWMHRRRVSVWQIPLTALCQLSVARHDSSDPKLSHVGEGAGWLPGIRQTSDLITLMFPGDEKQQVIVLSNSTLISPPRG